MHQINTILFEFCPWMRTDKRITEILPNVFFFLTSPIPSITVKVSKSILFTRLINPFSKYCNNVHLHAFCNPPILLPQNDQVWVSRVKHSSKSLKLMLWCINNASCSNMLLCYSIGAILFLALFLGVIFMGADDFSFILN